MRGQQGELVMLQEICTRGDLFTMIDRDQLAEADMRRIFSHIVWSFIVSLPRLHVASVVGVRIRVSTLAWHHPSRCQAGKCCH